MSDQRKSFEAMANEDPEISHLMAYRSVRRFLRVADKIRQGKATKSFVVVFNVGGLSNMHDYLPTRLRISKEWEEAQENI